MNALDDRVDGREEDFCPTAHFTNDAAVLLARGTLGGEPNIEDIWAACQKCLAPPRIDTCAVIQRLRQSRNGEAWVRSLFAV